MSSTLEPSHTVFNENQRAKPLHLEKVVHSKRDQTKFFLKKLLQLWDETEHFLKILNTKPRNKKKNRQKVPKKVLKKFRKKVLKIDEEYYAELFEKNWLQKSQKNDQKQRRQTEYKIWKTLVRREILYEKHSSANQQ